MEIPSTYDSVWRDILTEKKKFDFEFLAIKMLLTRLVLRVQTEPDSLEPCIVELSEFFKKNLHMPKVQADLKKITG